MVSQQPIVVRMYVQWDAVDGQGKQHRKSGIVWMISPYSCMNEVQDDEEQGDEDEEDGGGDGDGNGDGDGDNDDSTGGLPDELPDGLPEDAGDVDLAGASVFGIGSGEDCVEETRDLGEERFLVIFYRYATEDDEEPRNAITEEMVAKVRTHKALQTLHFSRYRTVCSVVWSAGTEDREYHQGVPGVRADLPEGVQRAVPGDPVVRDVRAHLQGVVPYRRARALGRVRPDSLTTRSFSRVCMHLLAPGRYAS